MKQELHETCGSIHLESVKKLIGYCPQTNLIFDYMSVEEIQQEAGIEAQDSTLEDIESSPEK